MRYIVTFKARSAGTIASSRKMRTPAAAKMQPRETADESIVSFRGGKEEFGVFEQCIQGNAVRFKNRFILLDTVTFKPFTEESSSSSSVFASEAM